MPGSSHGVDGGARDLPRRWLVLVVVLFAAFGWYACVTEDVSDPPEGIATSPSDPPRDAGDGMTRSVDDPGAPTEDVAPTFR